MAISRKQMQILAFPYSKYDAIIAEGAIRTGKTVFMVMAFVDDAMRRYDRQLFAICGKTVASATKNIINPYMGMSLPHEKYNIRWKRTDNLMVVSDGERENYFEVFGGKDESSFTLIQGRTLAGVLLDEVALQPRSFVEQALARCSVPGSKLWFNCNPGPPSHWFYTEWILQPEKHNAVRIHFDLEDNPALDQKIIERYKSMYTGVFYDRYIRGLWVVAEGLVYPMFNDTCMTEDVPDAGEYYISCDYGTLNPFSAGLWSVRDGKAVRIREYYYSGRSDTGSRTDEEHYKEVEKLAGDLPISRIIVDPSAASFIEVVRRHKKYTVQKANNDVMNGIVTTARFLKDGRIKIHKDCKDAIREFGLYRWDDKSEKDSVIKENDHAMDDIRYFAYTVLRHKEKSAYKPLWM